MTVHTDTLAGREITNRNDMKETELSVLAQPILLPCGQELPSRIMKSAMSEALGTPTHGPRDGLLRLYEIWGQGGPSLLITGNIMIDQQHLGEPGNVVVEDDRHLEQLKLWARGAKAHGCHIWGQINHPGKQTPKFLTKEPVSASSVPLDMSSFNCPRALSSEAIGDIIGRYANTAAILKKAGFDGVQIHGAHGYLVAQFLSPRHNIREDEWGGSLENRCRFVEQIFLAIREKVGPSFAVGIKLNSSDFQKGGFTEEESLVVIKRLAELGIDHIEISGGNYEAPSMMGSEDNLKGEQQGYFVEFAERAKAEVTVPIAVTGGFRTVSTMEQAVVDQRTDMIGLARPYVLYPNLAGQAINGEAAAFEVPYRLSTGLKFLDNLVVIRLTWYTRQIHILASDKTVYRDLHPLWAALGLLWNTGWQYFRRTRV